ncbi:DUF4388 domain-containing protein [Acidobacteriota bacterium]
MRIEVKGDLDELDLPELINSICDTQETGVLSVRREGAERSLFFRKGQLIFASSTDRADSFGAFLFRRGILSLETYEELRGQVDSGKRFGALLLEKKVFSADELVDIISDHLLEIALNLFTWGEGRYRFVLGEQPVGESILVEVKPENLLLKGIRRIEHWERIRQGCGGVSLRFKVEKWALKSPERIELDETDTTVARGLADGKDLEEIISKDGLDPYAAGRSVWGLRLIGAIVPLESAGSEPAREVIPEPISETEELPPSQEVQPEPAAVSSEDRGLLEAFNQRHSTLFRFLKEEVGAGAGLFVTKCMSGLDAHTIALFQGLEPKEEGEWDLDVIQQRLRKSWITDPSVLFQEVLEAEVNALCDMVDPAKEDEIRKILSSEEPKSTDEGETGEDNHI